MFIDSQKFKYAAKGIALLISNEVFIMFKIELNEKQQEIQKAIKAHPLYVSSMEIESVAYDSALGYVASVTRVRPIQTKLSNEEIEHLYRSICSRFNTIPFYSA